MDETPDFNAVSSAPNETVLKIGLMKCTQSPDDTRKWLVNFEIISASPVFGPQFATAGQTVDGFSFDSFEEYSAGELLTVHAEYLGDAHRGIYQLTQPRKT